MVRVKVVEMSADSSSLNLNPPTWYQVIFGYDDGGDR